ncbi:hypothetical protein KC967_00545 [Candidatus Saccharibacteria bacterium]|nr:hypothetical protein [Candidatus Saccharibacteria bacterium]
MTKKTSKETALILDRIDRLTNGLSDVVADDSEQNPPRRALVSLINTKPFQGTGIKSRAANKLFGVQAVANQRSFAQVLDQVDSLHNEMQSKLDEIVARNEAIERDLPALFNEKIYEVEKLIDRLKSEIMAEINKDISPVGNSEKIETKIINKDRYKEITRVNLGSGSFIIPEYINVDHREIDGVDVIADIGQLPYEPISLTEIYSSHVVEHFTERKLRELLKYWYGLLKPKGTIVMITPDIESMVFDYADKRITWDNLRQVVMGGQDYNSDYHFNMFSKGYMKKLCEDTLPEATIEIVETGRRNGECLEMEVKITK